MFSFRQFLPSIRTMSVACIAIASCVHFSSEAKSQLFYENTFDQWDEPQIYTRDEWDIDWLEPVWEDGIREERVSIVTGEEAYRGRGSALAVDFPAGSVGPKEGGAQWKFEWDEPVRMVRLRYRVRFSPNFDFNRGGKLPGLAGGTAPTGSTQADGFNGFGARMMWRTDFDGEPGNPAQNNANLVQYVKHPTSGFEGDGRQEDNYYYMDPDTEERLEIEGGRWYRITHLVKMNKIGRSNGRIIAFVNGKRVLDKRKLTFRYTPDLGINVFYFTTFFGGSSDEWQSPQDQSVTFDDIQIEWR